MTYREKLQKEHPEMVGSQFVGGCHSCPVCYGYEEDQDNCPCHTDKYSKTPTAERCAKCWDRVIPGTDEIEELKKKVKDLEKGLNEVRRKKYIWCEDNCCTMAKDKEIAELRQKLRNAENISTAKDIKIDHLMKLNKRLQNKYDGLTKFYAGVVDTFNTSLETLTKELKENDERT